MSIAKTAVAFTILAAMSTAASDAYAADTSWLTARSGDFVDPARWSMAVPGERDTAVFGTESSTNWFVVSAQRSLALRALRVNSQSPILALGANTMTLAPAAEGIIVDSAAGGAIGDAPSLTLQGGTLTAPSIRVAAEFQPGDSHSGVLVIDGTTVTTSSVDIGAENGDGIVRVRGGAKLIAEMLHFPSESPTGELVVTGLNSTASFDTPPTGTKRFTIENGGSIALKNQISDPPFSANDTVSFRIGPDGSGTLNNVFGTLKLAGTLRVELAEGYAPLPGQIFVLCQAFSIQGSFDVIEVPTFGGVPMTIVTVASLLLAIVPVVDTSLILTPDTINGVVGYPSNPCAASLVYDDGTTIPLTSGLSWSVDDPALASVAASGAVTSLAVGSTSLRCTYGNFRASVPLTITAAGTSSTIRASLSSEGLEADAPSDVSELGYSEPVISADGDRVAFASYATNLVSNDTNEEADVFVRFVASGTTVRVSVSSAGGQGNGKSSRPSISADGRFVSFRSVANNLVAGDSGNSADIFVHDLETGITEQVNVDANGQPHGGHAGSSALSADGRYVAFTGSSVAAPFGPIRVQRKDRATGAVEIVSVNWLGVPLYTNEYAEVAINSDGSAIAFTMSGLALPEQPLSVSLQVWLRDLTTAQTLAVSATYDRQWSDGHAYHPRIDASGRTVAFTSDATNLLPLSTRGNWNAYIYDRATGLLSLANLNDAGELSDEDSWEASLSGDGRFVSFNSIASNLDPSVTAIGLPQMYRRDRLKGTVELISAGPVGPANSSSGRSAMSADGEFVTYLSSATNLVPFDTNDVIDVFRTQLAPSVFADLDGDTAVGNADLAILLGAWGTNDFFPDLDRDGTVGPNDLGALLGAWTPE